MKAVAVIGALFCTSLAQAALIDFEEQASGTFTNFVSQGFLFEGDGGFGSGPAYVSGTTDKFLAVDAYTDSAFSPPAVAGIRMTRVDNHAFALFSLDASLFGDVTSICGTLAGGATVCDQSAIGTGEWLNIVRLDLFALTEPDSFNGFPRSSYISVDDISVGAPVPIPAAAWLFGSALAGLGWLRKTS